MKALNYLESEDESSINSSKRCRRHDELSQTILQHHHEQNYYNRKHQRIKT